MAFLQKSGTKFTLDGQRFYIFGCTVYASLYWYNDASIYEERIQSIADAGFNTVRFSNYMSVTEDAEFDDDVWERIDAVLDLCRQLNLKVILEHTEVSGIADFKGAAGSAEWMAVWEGFLSWLPNRVNTVNGRVYKNDDTIIIYSLIGESNRTAEQFNTLSGWLRAADPNHLICPGAQHPEQIYDTNYPENPSYVRHDMLSLANIDCAATEAYFDSNIHELFPYLTSYGESKNKPWFNIEFGYDQASHLWKRDTERAKKFRYVFDTCLRTGCAGVIFWNYDNGVGSGYGVSPSTDACWQMVKTYAQTRTYSRRLLVI